MKFSAVSFALFGSLVFRHSTTGAIEVLDASRYNLLRGKKMTTVEEASAPMERFPLDYLAPALVNQAPVAVGTTGHQRDLAVENKKDRINEDTANEPPAQNLAVSSDSITMVNGVYSLASLQLATPFTSDNGQNGNMFDVKAIEGIVIRRFDINLFEENINEVEIWKRSGTFVGFENSDAGWTKILEKQVQGAGQDIPTEVPDFTAPINVGAGETLGFYVTAQNDVNYSNGNAVGDVLASDDNLIIYEGVGKASNFGSTFTTRNWNGIIYYDLMPSAAPSLEPSSEPSLEPSMFPSTKSSKRGKHLKKTKSSKFPK
jgi:hypothetical protein